ncbi:MAG: hypothetical protein P8N52_07610 [Crocinitomicaceae bacterium]|nr:hypothetical protein [Crocinitomicaceae bacterium]MDG1776083.1 hypothetical protein [Crocinitomicaceae bacterium]
MAKEVRLLFLTALTLLIYALSIFFDKGVLLFPFPLNQLILLIVAVQLTRWNFKSYKTASVLILATGLFSTLGNEIYWNTFLDSESMTLFSKTITTDIFQLLSVITTLFLAIYTGYNQNSRLNYILLGLFCCAFSTGIILSSPLLSCELLSISYLIMVISTRISPTLKPIQTFWILLFILEFSKLISILLNN